MKVLKFGAVWCPGCLVMHPRWRDIENERPWLKTEYYDYDGNRDIADKWKITKILPAFIFVDDEGSEITRLVGEQPKKKLIELIDMYKDK